MSLGFKKNQSPIDIYNVRRLLEALLEKEGAEITGGGTGFGRSDFDFTLKNQSFNVSIRPL